MARHPAHLAALHGMLSGSSTARQPLPEEEATEATQRGDATHPQPAGAERGLKLGGGPPSRYL